MGYLSRLLLGCLFREERNIRREIRRGKLANCTALRITKVRGAFLLKEACLRFSLREVQMPKLIHIHGMVAEQLEEIRTKVMENGQCKTLWKSHLTSHKTNGLNLLLRVSNRGLVRFLAAVILLYPKQT